MRIFRVSNLLIVICLGFSIWFLGFGMGSVAAVGQIDPAIQEILAKVKDNQGKIKDMQAEVITVIRSEIGQKKTMEQKGKMWIKGADKTKMEITSPIKQISITSGDKMIVVNPETGQKYVQDLKMLRKKTGQVDFGSNPMDQTKALAYFNLKLKKAGGLLGPRENIIEGTPREKNKFLGKVNFIIDAGRNLPTKIEIYNPQGSLVSSSDIEYIKIKDIWVIEKNKTIVKMPNGKMDVEMKFQNIKLNEGIADSVFE